MRDTQIDSKSLGQLWSGVPGLKKGQSSKIQDSTLRCQSPPARRRKQTVLSGTHSRLLSLPLLLLKGLGLFWVKKYYRASLVAKWLRICLPMQGTRVRALVWEDPTCRGATRPVSHKCWACASGACAPQREAATVRGPRTAMKSGPHLPQLEKALAQKRRPNTAINT